jgi:hypothetical protein
MPKFVVRISGTVPDEVEVEAADKDAATDEAIDIVMDVLTFEAEPAVAEEQETDESDL